jgi:hypothetical protein
MREFERLSKNLAIATANLNAAIYYIAAIEKEEKVGNDEEAIRLSKEAAKRLENVTELDFDKKQLWEKSGDLYARARGQFLQKVILV